MSADRSIHRRRRVHLPCLVALVLALGGCGGSSSGTTAGATSVAAPSSSPSEASPTPAATNGHCAITPGVTPAATIKWNLQVEGGNPTIKAGQAVAFVTAGNERPTVTEGTKGTAVPSPCIDKVLSGNAPVVVTFAKSGVYNIFCRKEPDAMFTAIHVV